MFSFQLRQQVLGFFYGTGHELREIRNKKRVVTKVFATYRVVLLLYELECLVGICDFGYDDSFIRSENFNHAENKCRAIAD